jgi:hypothetical protein
LLGQLLGAIDEYNMDNTKLFRGDINQAVTEINDDFLKSLAEGDYFKKADEFKKLHRQSGCRWYFVYSNSASNYDYKLICNKHGDRTKGEVNGKLVSPREELTGFLEKHKVSSDKWKGLFNDYHYQNKPVLALFQPLKYLLNIWPAVFIVPVILIFVFPISKQKIGTLTKTYLFGTVFCAFTYLFSALPLIFTGRVIPGWKEAMKAPAIDGMGSFVIFSFYLFVGWWFISLLGLILHKIDKASLTIPVSFVIASPVLLFGLDRSGTDGFFPIFGAFIIYQLYIFRNPALVKEEAVANTEITEPEKLEASMED